MQTDNLASIEVFDDAVDSLSHHGILGQRWGRKNGPPYPLDDDDHSSAEKKAGWRKSLESVTSKFTRKKDAEPPKAEVKKEAKREETPEERKQREAREKQNIISSGNAELVRANADKLSYQELNEAVNRVNLMQRLDQMTPKEDTTNKIDKAIQVIDENATRVKKGIDTYNKVAEIYNKFSDPPLPVINESLADRRKKEEHDEIMKYLKRHPEKWVENVNNLSDEDLQTLQKRSANMNLMKKNLGSWFGDDNKQTNQQQNQGNQNQTQNQPKQQNQNQGNNGGKQSIDINVNVNGASQQSEGTKQEKQKTEKSVSDKFKMTKEQIQSYNENVEKLTNEARQRRIDQKYREEEYNDAIDSLLGREKVSKARNLDDIEKYGFSHSEDESDLPSFEYYAERLLEAIRA